MAVTLAERPRLLEPGLPRLEPGTERYRVAGGGAAILALSAGDRLTLIDLEGRQRAEVAAFSPSGVEDPAALGLSANGTAEGISRLLAGADENARNVAASLRVRGLPGGIARAADLFQHDSQAGEQVDLQAAR